MRFSNLNVLAGVSCPYFFCSHCEPCVFYKLLMIVDLWISSFNIANFHFVYFEAVLLGAYKFRILMLPVAQNI